MTNLERDFINHLRNKTRQPSATALINSNAGAREELEARHGRVWDTHELQREFKAIGFAAPYIVVQRRSDGAKGSLEFQHDPRFYFNWREYK